MTRSPEVFSTNTSSQHMNNASSRHPRLKIRRPHMLPRKDTAFSLCKVRTVTTFRPSHNLLDLRVRSCAMESVDRTDRSLECCMSNCAVCVLDLYAEALAEWKVGFDGPPLLVVLTAAASSGKVRPSRQRLSRTREAKRQSGRVRGIGTRDRCESSPKSRNAQQLWARIAIASCYLFH